MLKDVTTLDGKKAEDLVFEDEEEKPQLDHEDLFDDHQFGQGLHSNGFDHAFKEPSLHNNDMELHNLMVGLQHITLEQQ